MLGHFANVVLYLDDQRSETQGRAWGNGSFEIIAWFRMEQHKVWPAMLQAGAISPSPICSCIMSYQGLCTERGRQIARLAESKEQLRLARIIECGVRQHGRRS